MLHVKRMDICNYMDESHKCNAEPKKLDPKDTVYSYKNTKPDKINLFH